MIWEPDGSKSGDPDSDHDESHMDAQPHGDLNCGLRDIRGGHFIHGVLRATYVLLPDQLAIPGPKHADAGLLLYAVQIATGG